METWMMRHVWKSRREIQIERMAGQRESLEICEENYSEMNEKVMNKGRRSMRNHYFLFSSRAKPESSLNLIRISISKRKYHLGRQSSNYRQIYRLEPCKDKQQVPARLWRDARANFTLNAAGEYF